MRLAFLAFWALACVWTGSALFDSVARGADDETASSSGDRANPIHSKPPLHAHTSTSRDVELFHPEELPNRLSDIHSILPRISVAEATPEQRFGTIRSLQNRLKEYGRVAVALDLYTPSVNYDALHRAVLYLRLTKVADEKRAVFINITPDRQGRLLATLLPYKFNKKVSGPSFQKMDWSIIGVYPAKEGTPARMEWYVDASHIEPKVKDPKKRSDTIHLDGEPQGRVDEDEPAVKDLEVYLKKSRDANTLRHFLSKPL
ncbi:uncharacterized protein UTRI_06225_B [Ustilago trichophora]|uniref:Uncharacterized protein n=1 Tax=Ustilago trichophora TaxID=86804 RepID=A0A5C3EHQ2_9BASI|nr:uncharacterized protein UTRI_06225_B [Ustilago trichophora]